MYQAEGPACAKALCIKRHRGSFCHRAASRARSRWHTGKGRVLANTLAWAGFPLSPTPPCTTVSSSLETLCFDDHCQAVSDCDTKLHGQRVSDQTPMIRAKPFLFFFSPACQLPTHPRSSEGISSGHAWHPVVPSPAHLGL